MAMPHTTHLEQLNKNMDNIVELIGKIAMTQEHIHYSQFVYGYRVNSHLEDAMLAAKQELQVVTTEIENKVKGFNLAKLRHAEVMRVTDNQAEDVNFYGENIVVFNYDDLPHKIVFHKSSDNIDTFEELK
jgi:hypothetical protein